MARVMYLIALFTMVLTASPSSAGQDLVATKVDRAPRIDGVVDDEVWSRASPVVTRDAIADIDLTIRSVYTDDRVYMLVTFPDPDESRDQKTLTWDADQERYRTGSDREDTFVFKWSMEPQSIDLRLTADNPYRADVWFWKANRTDPVGAADDKMHVYSPVEAPESDTMISERGARYFLSRPGDEGQSSYQTAIYPDHVGDRMPKYHIRAPSGSRADIPAKGMWRDGVWTIEFGRKLVTGHDDDVQFDPDRRYQFGVSRFEIAGRTPNPALDQPNYGAGEVGETLVLTFQPANVSG